MVKEKKKLNKKLAKPVVEEVEDGNTSSKSRKFPQKVKSVKGDKTIKKAKGDKAAKKSKEGKPVKKVKNEEMVEEQQPTTASVDDVHKCLRYSLSDRYTAERHLFLKADGSNPQSLLIGNVPSYLDLDVIKGFLGQFVSVEIEDVVPLRSTAPDNRMDAGQLTISIVFSSPDGVQQALGGAESVDPFVATNFGQFDETSSLQNQIGAYAKRVVPRPAVLLKQVEEFMEEHDAVTKAAERASRKRTQLPDEDGWITVKKGSRKGAPEAKRLKQGEVPVTGRELKKKKKGEDVTFYSFEIKQTRLKRLDELRTKFEEDKKRVALAKAARKFKPL